MRRLKALIVQVLPSVAVLLTLPDPPPSGYSTGGAGQRHRHGHTNQRRAAGRTRP